MSTVSSNVRVRGQSEKHMLVPSSSQFDPSETLMRLVAPGVSSIFAVGNSAIVSPRLKII
jgi:hypothetical protein